MDLAVETREVTKRFWSWRGICGVLRGGHDGSRLYRETVALDGLNLRVPRGSVYGLLGRNGAGKTTAVQLLLGLLEADTGEVSVLGFDPMKDEVPMKQRVGHVADGQKMYEFYTVEELCRFCATFYPTWNLAWQNELLDRLDLPRDRRLGELSRGTKAQMALVLALAHEPELLLMDESTSGLDAVVRRQFLETLVELSEQAGRTALISSHIIDDLERVCDWVGILHRGRLIVQQPLDELKGSVQQIRATFAGAPPEQVGELAGNLVRSRRRERELLLTVQGFRADMVEQVRRLGATSAEAVPLSLEEIFIAYTGPVRLEERLGAAVADATEESTE